MGFYLIGPLVTLIYLGSISSWAFKSYCDDGLLGISPTDNSESAKADVSKSTAAVFHGRSGDVPGKETGGAFRNVGDAGGRRSRRRKAVRRAQ